MGVQAFCSLTETSCPYTTLISPVKDNHWGTHEATKLPLSIAHVHYGMPVSQESVVLMSLPAQNPHKV